MASSASNSPGASPTRGSGVGALTRSPAGWAKVAAGAGAMSTVMAVMGSSAVGCEAQPDRPAARAVIESSAARRTGVREREFAVEIGVMSLS